MPVELINTLVAARDKYAAADHLATSLSGVQMSGTLLTVGLAATGLSCARCRKGAFRPGHYNGAKVSTANPPG
jgi:hypothetical protein